MTRIKRMVIKGFKSFGNKTSLIFGDKFNCVLGPNGSGKSNIMDALCFVLGKGSAKGLRAEKAANLIYNGGKKNKAAKEGEVDIYFDNKNKVFPIDSEEIKITRIKKPTGQSVYKINDKKRTRQEVLELLSRANIDPDGYNIILQGDITRIVEMSSIERREIIEDIAGIGAYEDKKNKALKELEKVNEKIAEAEIILSERETYLKDLKKDYNQALKYKELNDRIMQSKATYLSMQIKKKNEKKETIERQIEKKKDEIKKTSEKIEKLRKEADEKRKEIEEINKEIEEKGEKEQLKIMKDVERLKVDVASNKTRISSHENEVQRLEARKNSLHSTISEIDAKIEELNEKKASFEKEKAGLLKDAEKIREKIDEIRKKNKMDDAESVESDIDVLDKEIEEYEQKVQQLREKQQDLIREKDRIEFSLESIDDRILKVSEVEKEHKKDVEKLKEKRNEFKKTTNELNKLLNDTNIISARISKNRKEAVEVEEKLSKLKIKDIASREKAESSFAVKAIVDSGKRFGTVYGTVSQLGKVSAKYSLAIEVAAGPRIKSIVVDTDKTAAECIKYLRQNRIGTASFIPLNKIRKEDKKAESYKSIKGVVGYAIDLINYDRRLKDAFSYVFGNTLVVENIDVARRIGIGKIRMATLEGDLIELSGAMHGGFRKKRPGHGFKEKETAEEIERLEKKSAELKKTIEILEKEKQEKEEHIERLRKFKAELEGEIIKTEKSLHLDNSDLEANKKEKKRLEDMLKDINRRISMMDKEVSAENNTLTKKKIKRQELRAKISMMRNPSILAEINAFEQKEKELREKIADKESSIRNIEMQIKNILIPEKDKTAKILSQHEKETKMFNDEIKALKEKIKKQEKELYEKEGKQKEFYRRYKKLFEKKDLLVGALNKTENKIVELENTMRNADEKANILEFEKKTIAEELEVMEEEFAKYKGVKIIKNKTEEQIKRDIWQFEKMQEQQGNVNMKALEIYDSVKSEYDKLMKKRDVLKVELEKVKGMIDEIEDKKKELFMKTFDIISENFVNMFKRIATKGTAYLELENKEKPFEAGVNIKVKISGKKFLDIRSLSGGEKTLTALAFIFAIQEYEPASFYVLDEVDAALDKRNSEQVARLIKDYSEKAQYIIISHNDGMISEADTLYGVSMDENGISKVVSLKI